jgi:hypothetical protein
MKRKLLAALLIAFALCSAAAAQEPPQCIVSGTIRTPGGVLKNGRVRILKIEYNGALYSDAVVTRFTDANGAFSISLPRNSAVWIEAPTPKLNRPGGTRVLIPDAPTADINNLLPLTDIPTPGIIVYNELIPFLNRAGTLKFEGAGVNVVETATGVATVTIPGGGAGVGDVTSNTGTSIDSEVVLFSGTGGKTIKRASASGIMLLTAGVASVLNSSGTGDVLRNNGPTIITPVIASFVNALHDHDDAAGGGQLNAANVFSAGIVPVARLGSGSPGVDNFLRGDGTWATPAGSGDVTSNTASSVDSELALFSGTTGKIVKRGTGTGIPLLTAGVVSVLATSGTGDAIRQNSPTILTPTVASFVNAGHSHADAAGGGQLSATNVFSAGTVPTARLGSGTADSTTFLRGDSTWATPPGTGTVTVVASGSLTNTALVTGGGTTTLQTPCPTCTLDGSGNFSIPGTLSFGVGGAGATILTMFEGTAPSAPAADSMQFGAPANITTAYRWEVPVAAGTGFVLGTNASNVVTTTFVSFSGTGDVVRATSPTNVTFDVEGTGNSFTAPFFIEFVAAGVAAGTAGTMLDTPASNGAAPATIAGTNSLYAVLDFDAGTDESAQGAFKLPSDWSGAIDFDGVWFAAATSGNVIWALQTVCVADAETGDPAFNTAQTATDAAKGTTLQWNDFSIASVTTTGCAAGETLMFKFFRDADNGSDTMTGDARLKSIRFKLRRAM